ncbi:DUF4352 domain-containing protein [Cognatiluteimonas telluris]|uniref:DUF4352 domain-containing protein n=1 Tax=Cognatiluteimonas telluris TaxID=1104775 RepID=UPI00140DB339|nr:DUF4352 domain-containing protein [Lysobacter telluris]
MQIARAIVLGCVVLLATGCQRPDTDTNRHTETAGAVPAVAAPDLAITVHDVIRTPRIPRSKFDAQEAAAGDTYLVLDITVGNPGPQSRLFSGGPLIAIDGRRQRRFDAPENVLADGYLLLETLAPGASERGRIVYEVPDDLRGPFYWQPMGGKRLLLDVGAASASHTLAQAPATDAPAPDDATSAEPSHRAVAPPAQANTMPPAGGAATSPDAAAAARQLRQLACRALVEDNRSADKPRYLHFFQTQCRGIAMPPAWSAEADATTAPPAPQPAPPQHPAAPPARTETADANEPPAPVAPDDGGPSFDCRTAATHAEQLVCQDALLSLLDRQLADAYASAQREVGDPVALQRDEDDWRRRVRDACQSLNCLERVYTRRTATLRAVGGFVDAD